MPKIPDDITRAIPRPSRGVVSLRPNAYQGAQDLGEGLYSVGATDLRIQQQQREVQAQFDTSRAETELTKSHLTTINSLEGDDYAQYSPTYQKAMADAKGNAAQLIRDPMARAKFELNADATIARGESQVMDRAKSKETDLGRASLITDVDQLSNLGLASNSEPDRVAALNSINARINGAHAKGYIDAEQAANLRQKATIDYTVKSFELLPPAARIAALSGVRGSNETDMTDQYNTALSPDQEAQYQQWIQTLPEKQRNTYDYDMRGAFQAGMKPAANGHFPDTYKKPNHPTFSTQSQYNGAGGIQGGTWKGETYVPAKGSALTSFLPPDVRATLLERAQSELVTQQNAQEHAQKEAIDKGIIAAGNAIDVDPSRGLAAVSPDLLKMLNPDQKMNLQRYADAKSKGREVQTDMAYMDRMQTLAARDPQRYVDEFSITDVMAHAAPSDAEKLVNLKTGIIKGDPETKDYREGILTIDEKMNGVIRGDRDEVGKIDDPVQQRKFREGVNAGVMQWQRENPGKHIPDAESTKIIQQQLIKVTVPGMLWDSHKYPFQLPDGATTTPSNPSVLSGIPADHLAAIRKAFPTATDDQVLAIYHEANP